MNNLACIRGIFTTIQKRFAYFLLVFVLLTLAIPTFAYLTVPLDSIDDYVHFAKTVVIVECLPAGEDPVYARVFCRKVRILGVLLGEAKKEQVIHVIVGQSLTPSCVYMIYSGQGIAKDELDATSYEPAVFPISLWSEMSKAEKEKCLADFLKELEPLSLKDKLLLVIRRSVFDLKEEQKERKQEQEELEKLLPR